MAMILGDDAVLGVAYRIAGVPYRSEEPYGSVHR